jgi:hypothetical protein
VPAAHEEIVDLTEERPVKSPQLRHGCFCDPPIEGGAEIIEAKLSLGVSLVCSRHCSEKMRFLRNRYEIWATCV